MLAVSLRIEQIYLFGATILYLKRYWSSYHTEQPIKTVNVRSPGAIHELGARETMVSILMQQ